MISRLIRIILRYTVFFVLGKIFRSLRFILFLAVVGFAIFFVVNSAQAINNASQYELLQ